MNYRQIIISVVVLMVGITVVNAAVPYTVKGYVKDVNGTLVNNINVTVTALNTSNLGTGEISEKSMVTVTDINGIDGFYSISFTFNDIGNYYFKVKAKDTAKSNSTFVNSSLPTFIVNLTLIRKGDVDGYLGITMADAMYIGKAVLGKPGFTLNADTMDVDGQAGVTLNDALYLAKYVIGVPGFGTLQ